MADPLQLRQHAARCLERADKAKDLDARNAWLDMAANWLRLAGTNERHLTGQQQQQQIQPDASRELSKSP